MTDVVLITGGTGALGSAVASAFVTAGTRVAVTFTREAEFTRLRKSVNNPELLDGFFTDLTETASVERTVKRIETECGPIAAAVLAAGGYHGGTSIAETTDHAWNRMMNVNLKAAFVTARAVYPGFIARKRGSLVAIASLAARHAQPGVSAYAAAKAGLLGLTQVLAVEGAVHGIRANAILPGIIDTAANREAMPMADRAKWVPPNDIATLAWFLCSSASEHINGAMIPIGGA